MSTFPTCTYLEYVKGALSVVRKVDVSRGEILLNKRGQLPRNSLHGGSPLVEVCIGTQASHGSTDQAESYVRVPQVCLGWGG